MGIFITEKLTNSPIWDREKFSRAQAFIDLLIAANKKTVTKVYDNRPKTFRRGCIYKSNSALAYRFHWSASKVTTFLKELETGKFIRVNGRGIEREIEILDYDSYDTQNENKDKYFEIPESSDNDDEEDDWFDRI